MNKKTLIFSYYNGNKKDDFSFKEIAELTNQSKESYCKVWGHDFICSEVLEYNKQIGYYKIDFFIDKLKSGFYDWCVYIEADAMICNQTISLDYILDDNYDFIIAKNALSKGWDGLNCGVMAIRNSEWSLKFLDKINNKEQFWSHPWQEQQSIINEFENNTEEMIKHTRIFPNKLFNSYYHGWYEKDRFSPPDFICHGAGLHNRDRYKLFTFLQDKIIKIPDYKIPFKPFI